MYPSVRDYVATRCFGRDVDLESDTIRLDAAFFKAHPEFKGEVRATVLADGQVLLSAKPGIRKAKGSAKGEDPVVLGFLRFLEKEQVTSRD